DAVREALKEVRLFRSDAQVVELSLRLSPGERVDAVKCCRITAFVRHVERLMARLCDKRPETHARRLAFGDADAATQAENRIENAAHGIGKRPAFIDRNRGTQELAAA